jgi:hypothetical protein
MLTFLEKNFFTKTLLAIVVSAGLSGCATYAGIKDDTGVPVVDVLTTIKQGKARLPCKSFGCLTAIRNSSANIVSLDGNRSWTELATEIARVGYSCDMTYFYLGRAVEGLGYESAAATYYRLALSEVTTCVPDQKYKLQEIIQASLMQLPHIKAENAAREQQQRAEIAAKELAEKERLAARERLLSSSQPEEVYLAGVKYETETDYDSAKAFYNHIVTNFPKIPIALKAADRLLAINDKLDRQKRDSDAMGIMQLQQLQQGYQHEENMNQQKQLCEAQRKSCYAGCKKNDYSCSSRCGSISCY